MLRLDGHEHRLIEGYAALVLSHKHVLYSYRQDSDSLVSWCEAEGPPSPALAEKIGANPVTLPVSRRLLELQKIGVDLEEGDSEPYEALTRSLGETLYAEYLYQAERLTLEKPIHRAVLRAKSFIEETYTSPCNLKQIADFSHVTPQYLARLFKKQLNQTPIQYLWSLRAKRGAQLLRRSGLSVAEVAYACGYENPNHFSRTIRERFGVTPTELRRRRWEGPAPLNKQPDWASTVSKM